MLALSLSHQCGPNVPPPHCAVTRTATRAHTASKPTELTVAPNDIIRLNEINRDLWAFGTSRAGSSGWFPLTVFAAESTEFEDPSKGFQKYIGKNLWVFCA